MIWNEQPAFPCSTHALDHGLDMRDYFAGQVIGPITLCVMNDPDSRKQIEANDEWHRVPTVLAERAYAIADAMMAERRKEPAR